MWLSYARRELARNPRRTLASLVGVTLGVALFSGILFFVDGSGASMTARALAPLPLDMQRILTSPLGAGLTLTEHRSPAGPLRVGQTVKVALKVTNGSTAPAHEVVVGDRPPAALAYVPGTTTLAGKRLRDRGGESPLNQGLAGTGLNIGTLKPRESVRLTYRVRATEAAATPTLRGRVSSREDVVPNRANAPAQASLRRLAAKIARVPGVASVEPLAFVDLPPGSAHAGGVTVGGPVRVFAFDRAYLHDHEGIQIVAGRLAAGGAVLSAETARALRAQTGGQVTLDVPGRRKALGLPVAGVADLSRAKALFYSRKASDLESFLYVPNSVVVDPATFERAIVPAYRDAQAAVGTVVKSAPLVELDVGVERSRLRSDPAAALAQTQAVARAVRRVAAGQDYLIDNISNTLEVARDDAAVAKRMFVFLGIPGALLAAFLSAFSGGVLAGAQRREQAILRIRGAHRGHLRRLLAYRTLAVAGVGAILGVALGLITAMGVLGPDTLLRAGAGGLVASAAIAFAAGLVTTAAALYLPARRALRREIAQDRAEMSLAPVPAWRRARLDLVLLVIAVAANGVALGTGAFDAPAGSVYAGRAVSLPSYLLLAPVVIWVAGTLLVARGLQIAAARLRLPVASEFGPAIAGTLRRNLRRRSWSLAGGVVAVGLVVAFGSSLALFAASYDAAKAADARFVLGSDLRITPSVRSGRAHPPSFASQLEVPGVAAATPVVFKPENSVVIGPYTEDHEDLAAIDPASFGAVTPLADSSLAGGSAAAALAALRADPHGVLLDAQVADDLQIENGSRIKVLFARGTKHQKLTTLHVVGIFASFPGFPNGAGAVANLGYYEATTGLHHADFFLARTADRSDAGLARALEALRAGPGRHDALAIDTRETALAKDQSSLTALNVHGLVDLDSLYTLLMVAASLGIYVFGLMLQRRREYITVRALGLRASEIRALVLGEAAVVAGAGLIGGLLVGTGMAYVLVHILRPLFILTPALAVSPLKVAGLGLLTLTAALASALAASALLGRLRPAELLRET